MANIVFICWVSFLFLSLVAGLTGIDNSILGQNYENVTADNLSGINESENLTGFEWTTIRNENQKIIDDMKVSLDTSDPWEEDEIEYITDRLMEEIERSVSYETSDAGTSIKHELFFIIRDPAYEYSGPAAMAETFSVSVFRTMADPLVSKPSYLSREYVVKYNITFMSVSSEDKTEDTIWWYESDASKIVRYLMNSTIGGNIAVMSITFNDAADGGSAAFVLEAEDLEKLKKYWVNDDSYVRYFDWSDLVIDKEGLVYYEDPSTGIDLPAEVISQGINSGVKTADIDDSLKSDLRAQSYELMETVDGIKRSVSAGNLEGTQKYSEELMDLSRSFSSGIAGYSVDDESKILIDEYISGIRSLSKAGAHYWDKALLPNEIYDENSIEDLREGIERINNALGYIGESGYDAEELQIVSPGSYSDCLTAGTAFHYKDEGENNDISIKITSYYLKNRLLIKEGTTMEYQEAGFCKRYLGVVVDIMHLGYRGKGSQQITTPDKNSFSLYYDGNTYTPLDIENYIEDMGEVYGKKTLNRLERYESLLIFEIEDQDSFDSEKAYVSVNLGKYGEKIWQLSSKI